MLRGSKKQGGINMFKVIDVSSWNGKIDFNAVKNDGVDGVIIRAGFGRLLSQKDERFEINYQNAKNAGLKVGCYWFCYADNRQDAITEANTFLEVIKDKVFELPLYYDVENDTRYDFVGKGVEECSAIAENFCITVEQHGYFIGIYSNKNVLESGISTYVKNRFALWVAQYYKECTYKDTPYGMWQYTSQGKVNGIDRNVDINEMYIDYANEIAKRNLNGFSISQANSAFEYTVKQGDTLWRIAETYLKNGNRYKEIMQWNGLETTLIRPNQKLLIHTI